MAAGLVVLVVLAVVGTIAIGRAQASSSPAASPAVVTLKAGRAASWKLTQSASTVVVGHSFTLEARVGASGGTKGFKVQIDHVGKYADIIGCSPNCSTTRDPENISATFGPSVSAATSVSIEMLAKRSGQSRWTVCFYDIANTSNQLYCGDITTTFR